MDQNPYESPREPPPEIIRDGYRWTIVDVVFIVIGVLSAIVILLVFLPAFQVARE